MTDSIGVEAAAALESEGLPISHEMVLGMVAAEKANSLSEVIGAVAAAVAQLERLIRERPN